MELTGSHEFNAPRERVWAALMSEDALRTAIPGCTELEPGGEGRYRVAVKVSLAAMTGAYSGTIRVGNAVSPKSYRLEVDGSGRAGRVQATADIDLADSAGGTTLNYRADVRPQGAIARLGARLLGSAANMLLGQFFAGIAAHLNRGA